MCDVMRDDENMKPRYYCECSQGFIGDGIKCDERVADAVCEDEGKGIIFSTSYCSGLCSKMIHNILLINFNIWYIDHPLSEYKS